MQVPLWLSGKESIWNTGDLETGVQPLGWEAPLEGEMETPSRTLDWTIPWKEETGGLLSMGWKRVGRDRATEHIHRMHIYIYIYIYIYIHTHTHRDTHKHIYKIKHYLYIHIHTHTHTHTYIYNQHSKDIKDIHWCVFFSILLPEVGFIPPNKTPSQVTSCYYIWPNILYVCVCVYEQSFTLSLLEVYTIAN